MHIALRLIVSVPLIFAYALLGQADDSQRVRPLPSVKNIDESGFRIIFNGDIKGEWQGNTTYWRMEQGVLIGEVTAQNNPKATEYLIWRRGTTRNFELKLQYKVSTAGNSGVSYRSVELPKLALSGYQADIDGPMWGKTTLKSMDTNMAAEWSFIADTRMTGGVYEEHGRQFLALQGQLSYLTRERQPQVLASLGNKSELNAVIRPDDWNEYHLIARGPVHIHILNGRVMSVFIDDDAEHRRLEGKLGLQIHPGPPMQIAFRNIRLKNLD